MRFSSASRIIQVAIEACNSTFIRHLLKLFTFLCKGERGQIIETVDDGNTR